MLLSFISELFLVFLKHTLVGLGESVVSFHKFYRRGFVQRLAHQKSLNVIALHIRKEVILPNRLDTLRYSMYAEVVNKVDYRVGDSVIALIVVYLVNKGLVNFKTLYRKIFQIVQRRIARAEIIQSKCEAQIVYLAYNASSGIGEVYQGAIGYFKL